MRFREQFRALVTSSDYDRSVAFYRDTLGLDTLTSWDDPHGRGTVFRAANGLIEVLTGQGSLETPGLGALVIQVEDADEAYRELVARGASASETASAPWGHRLFYVNAPDGVRLVFFQELAAG
ncbi:MAG: VOC family protein [Chloroflexi bacterium]|nr:VOC family protein [Chloroflexota bacterium]